MGDWGESVHGGEADGVHIEEMIMGWHRWKSFEGRRVAQCLMMGRAT